MWGCRAIGCTVAPLIHVTLEVAEGAGWALPGPQLWRQTLEDPDGVTCTGNKMASRA